jgi:hypothetical protein
VLVWPVGGRSGGRSGGRGRGRGRRRTGKTRGRLFKQQGLGGGGGGKKERFNRVMGRGRGGGGGGGGAKRDTPDATTGATAGSIHRGEGVGYGSTLTALTNTTSGAASRRGGYKVGDRGWSTITAAAAAGCGGGGGAGFAVLALAGPAVATG